MPLLEVHDVDYGSSDEELLADLLQLLDVLEGVPSECDDDDIIRWMGEVARHLAQRGFLERRSEDWRVRCALARCLAAAVAHGSVCRVLGLRRLEAAVTFVIVTLGRLVQHGEDIRAEAERRREMVGALEDETLHGVPSEELPERRIESPALEGQQEDEHFEPVLRGRREQQGEEDDTEFEAQTEERGAFREIRLEWRFEDPDSSCCDLIKELHRRKMFVTLASTRLQVLLYADLVHQLLDLLNVDNNEVLAEPVLQLLLQVAGVKEVTTVVLDALLAELVKKRKVHTCALIQRFLNEIPDELQLAVSEFLQWDIRNQVEPSVDVRLHIFRVLAEVYVTSPSLAAAALLHLEPILQSQDVAKRRAAVLCLSTVLAERAVDLSCLKTSLLSAFVKRFNDIDEEVRTECAASTGFLLLGCRELLGIIAKILRQRQHDPNVSVRRGIVRGIAMAAKKESLDSAEESTSATAARNVLKRDLLPILAERVFDTDREIRHEASLALAFLYRRHASCCWQSTLAWTASPVLRLYLLDSAEDRNHVEKLFRSKLVPVSAKTEYRMLCLHHLHRSLTSQAKWAFAALHKNCFTVFSLLEGALRKIVGAGDSTLREKERLSHIVTSLAAHHRNEEVATRALVAVLNELSDSPPLRDALLSVLEPENEVARRTESIEDAISQLTSDPEAVGVFHSLLLTATCNTIGTKDVVVLLTLLKEDPPREQTDKDNRHDFGFDSCKDAPTLLQVLAGTFCLAFLQEDIITELGIMLGNEPLREQALRIFVELASELDSCLEETFPDFVEKLQGILTSGTLREVKLAIKCLANTNADMQPVFANIIEEERGNIVRGSERCRTAVVILGHVASCKALIFEEDLMEIFKSIMQTWLLDNEMHHTVLPSDWCEYHLLPEEIKIKVECTKALVRFVLGLQTNVDLARATFSFLFQQIETQRDGDGRNTLENSAEEHWLRYVAVSSVLKLCCCINYSHVLSLQQFQRLALVATDRCWKVRQGFVLKLSKYLEGNRLPVYFLALFAHVAHDDVPTLRRWAAKMFLRCIHTRQKKLQDKPAVKASRFLRQPDYAIPFAVHLLAHHPDLDRHTNVAVLTYIKKCLEFILKPLLRHSAWYSPHFYVDLLETIKQMKDAQDPSSEEATLKLYTVCDVALGVVISKGPERNSGIPSQKVALPMKLFVPQKEMVHWNKKMYLTKEVLFTPPRRKGVDMRSFGLKRARPPSVSSEESDEEDKYPPRHRFKSSTLRTSFHEPDVYSDFDSGDDIDPSMLSVNEYLQEKRSERESHRMEDRSLEREQSPEEVEESWQAPSSSEDEEEAIVIQEDPGIRRMRMIASLMSSPSEDGGD